MEIDAGEGTQASTETVSFHNSNGNGEICMKATVHGWFKTRDVILLSWRLEESLRNKLNKSKDDEWSRMN